LNISAPEAAMAPLAMVIETRSGMRPRSPIKVMPAAATHRLATQVRSTGSPRSTSSSEEKARQAPRLIRIAA
jgi:hypothetical protein